MPCAPTPMVSRWIHRAPPRRVGSRYAEPPSPSGGCAKGPPLAEVGRHGIHHDARQRGIPAQGRTPPAEEGREDKQAPAVQDGHPDRRTSSTPAVDRDLDGEWRLSAYPSSPRRRASLISLSFAVVAGVRSFAC